MTIWICSLAAAPDMAQRLKPSRVVSLLSPYDSFPSFSGLQKDLHLQVAIHDIASDIGDWQAPAQTDAEQLDAVLPRDIPVPPIAEVQVALQEAAEKVTGETGDALKQRLRTGTVVTTDDRNWELRFTDSAKRFNKSRAIAIDMESATIAANGYRMRVPYGVLLCVSDKPLHGEIKLAGAANRFYERAIGEHIRIGIETLESLALAGGDALHSRKLRSFYEPPFR